MSSASCTCVTTGMNTMCSDTSGAGGSRIQGGARQIEAGSKNTIGSLAYCRNTMRSRPHSVGASDASEVFEA